MPTILDHIPTGAANAIPRAELAARLELSDRRTREAIQKARDDGALILNEQGGAGYYVATADDLDAIERQYRQDTSRALSILRRRKAMRALLKAAGRAV